MRDDRAMPLPSMMRDDAIVPREYQTKIAPSALKSNTLVVLPTGLGKTMVALLVSDARLRLGDSAKVLFLAPTKPLADQHDGTVSSMLAVYDDPDRFFSLLTGDVIPEKRQKAWSEARLIFATPETVLNDLNSGRASLRDFVLLVFDEAHRCVKDYAYTQIAQWYMKQAENQLIVGLTASPGVRRRGSRTSCATSSSRGWRRGHRRNVHFAYPQRDFLPFLRRRVYLANPGCRRERFDQTLCLQLSQSPAHVGEARVKLLGEDCRRLRRVEPVRN